MGAGARGETGAASGGQAGGTGGQSHGAAEETGVSGSARVGADGAKDHGSRAIAGGGARGDAGARSGFRSVRVTAAIRGDAGGGAEGGAAVASWAVRAGPVARQPKSTELQTSKAKRCFTARSPFKTRRLLFETNFVQEDDKPVWI